MNDQEAMQLALSRAAQGCGRTSPNPPVGCVIVAEGKVIGEGFHARAGLPHAEVMALSEAGNRARGATAYVTLEPCSHFGRTPPCTEALIKAGIARVVVATIDPNPLVSGRGISRLREAGLEVCIGEGREIAEAQQAGFRSVMTRGRPYVIYKYAMTLDGKIAALHEGNGRISGAVAGERVMEWRNQCDGVAVGIGTVLADNPRLTTRGIPDGRDAKAVIFDRWGRTPPNAHALREGTVLVVSPEYRGGYEHDPRLNLIRAHTLTEALQTLAALDISSLLLEGGSRLASAFFEMNLIDEWRIFLAPKLLGEGLPPLLSPMRRMHEAQTLDITSVEQVGCDWLFTAKEKRCSLAL